MGYYTWQAQESFCVVCGTSLKGNQERYCSAACRQMQYRLSKLTSDQLWELRTGRDCAECGDAFEPRSPRQRFCSPICAARKKDAETEAREDAICELEGCENNTGWDGVGRARRYCCNAHKTKAYRLRKATERASEGR